MERLSPVKIWCYCSQAAVILKVKWQRCKTFFFSFSTIVFIQINTWFA